MTFAVRSCWNTDTAGPPPVVPHVSLLYSVSSTSDDDIIIALNGNPFILTPYFWPMTTPVSATIDWGDGTSNTYTTGGNKSHHYSTFGTFTVTITGTCTTIGLEAGNRLGVSSWETGMGLEAISFSLSALPAANFSTVPAALPLSLKCVRFAYCTSFNSPNILSWDESQLTNMDEMFMSCYAFNQPIGSWDISGISTLRRTLAGTLSFNQDISSWNTANITSLESTFESAYTFNQDISSWNTSSVTNMRATFFAALVFNQPLNSWDTSSVTTMGEMFRSAGSFNQPLHQWDTTNVVTMGYMFFNATVFNQDISMWCVTNVPSLPTLFATNCPLYQLSYPQWGTCPANYLPIRLYNNGFTGAIQGTLPITVNNSVQRFSGQGTGADLPITLSR